MADAVPRTDLLSADKEAQILDGAALIFASDGFEGASMSRIAARAGVSKGTLYNYFDGKAALFAAYVQRECTARITVIFDDMDPAAPPAESLRRICRRLMDMLLSDAGIVIYRMVIAEAAKFPELGLAFHEAGPQQGIRHMTAWIERTAALGLLRVDEPTFAAEQLFALTQTALCMKRRLHMIDRPSEQEIDRVVDASVHLFLRGYGV